MKTLFKHYKVLLILFMLLAAAINLAACGNETPTTPVAEVAEEEPSATPVPPTDTPEPTNTPLPTDTPAPTATPTDTSTPTNTPTATHTPTNTPTNTPEPTDTPAATNTPIPTNTPAASATPRPPVATATPEATATSEVEATPEFITIYYISNPNDILGVFPVKPFDADELRQQMSTIQFALNTMRSNLDAAKAGDAAACANYVSAYNNILYSGIFFEPVPPDWQDIDYIYFLSFIYALDRTRPAYLACVDGGAMGDFNYGLAYTAIEDTLSILNPAIISANSR